MDRGQPDIANWLAVAPDIATWLSVGQLNISTWLSVGQPDIATLLTENQILQPGCAWDNQLFLFNLYTGVNSGHGDGTFGNISTFFAH